MNMMQTMFNTMQMAKEWGEKVKEDKPKPVQADCKAVGSLSDRFLRNMVVNDPDASGFVTGAEILKDFVDHYDNNRDGCVSEDEWVNRWISYFGFSREFAVKRLNDITNNRTTTTCRVGNNDFNNIQPIAMDDFVNANIESLADLCRRNTDYYTSNCDCAQLYESCRFDGMMKRYKRCIDFIALPDSANAIVAREESESETEKMMNQKKMEMYREMMAKMENWKEDAKKEEEKMREESKKEEKEVEKKEEKPKLDLEAINEMSENIDCMYRKKEELKKMYMYGVAASMFQYCDTGIHTDELKRFFMFGEKRWGPGPEDSCNIGDMGPKITDSGNPVAVAQQIANLSPVEMTKVFFGGLKDSVCEGLLTYLAQLEQWTEDYPKFNTIIEGMEWA